MLRSLARRRGRIWRNSSGVPLAHHPGVNTEGKDNVSLVQTGPAAHKHAAYTKGGCMTWDGVVLLHYCSEETA